MHVKDPVKLAVTPISNYRHFLTVLHVIKRLKITLLTRRLYRVSLTSFLFKDINSDF